MSLASRLAAGARPFNLTVTNVPGPQFPMYLLDAKMLEQYPLVPLWHGHGVGIALFSYDGTLFWGFNGDYDIMEEMDEFVEAVGYAFRELLDLARSGDSVPLRQKSKRSAPKKRPPLGGSTKAAKSATSTAAGPKKRPPLGAKPGRERVAINGFTPGDEPVTIREFLVRYRNLDDPKQVSSREAEAVASYMREEYPRPKGVRGPWKLDPDQQLAVAAHLEG